METKTTWQIYNLQEDIPTLEDNRQNTRWVKVDDVKEIINLLLVQLDAHKPSQLRASMVEQLCKFKDELSQSNSTNLVGNSNSIVIPKSQSNPMSEVSATQPLLPIGNDKLSNPSNKSILGKSDSKEGNDTFICEECDIPLPKRKNFSYDGYYFCSEKCQNKWLDCNK